jgi:sulfur transfer protein SufE
MQEESGLFSKMYDLMTHRTRKTPANSVAGCIKMMWLRLTSKLYKNNHKI